MLILRIISATHDYYDGLMSMDQDRETLYLRKRVETKELPKVEVPDFPKFHMASYRYREWPHTIESIDHCMVGFCNKVYPIVRIWLDKNFEQRIVSCFNLEEVEDFFENHFSTDELAVYKSKGKFKWCSRSWLYRCVRKEWVQFFDECKQKQDSFEHLFDKHQSPIFSYREWGHRWSLVVNPVLKNMEFYRLFPAYQAYQELVMYLCNQTNPEKPIPKVDDETLIEIKGFDKYSFRKDKSK